MMRTNLGVGREQEIENELSEDEEDFEGFIGQVFPAFGDRVRSVVKWAKL